MSYKLISTLLKGAWAIEEGYAISMGQQVANFLAGNGVKFEGMENAKPYVINNNEYFNFLGDDFPEDSVAVIPIKGPVMKDDYCGAAGMAKTGRWIQLADQDSRINAIILRIDSPGGTVDGTETLANIVRNVQKPIHTFVDGLMASAALWIGSSTDYIHASTDQDEIGSVGVLLSFADTQPMWEESGVKFHKIVSTPNPDKTKDFDDIREGKYENYRKEVLDPIAHKFMDTVRTNIPSVKENQLTGKVFFAKDIIGTMIDGVQSFEQALEFAIEKGQKFKDMRKESLTELSALNDALGVESIDLTKTGITFSKEQVETINQTLEDANQKAATNEEATSKLTSLTEEKQKVEKERDQLKSEKEDAEKERDDLKSKNEKLDAKVEELSKNSDATETNVNTDKDNPGGEADEDPVDKDAQQMYESSKQTGSY